jgi:Domain of unknown function (DUF397)
MDAMTSRWRKSTYSGGNGGDCVQVGSGPGAVLVRDTKQASTGPVLAFSLQAWQRFTGQVREAA